MLQGKKGRAGDFARVPLDMIARNPNQPRRIFDRQDLIELCESIRSCGIITPLTVRRKDGLFELIAGERRLRAAFMAGLDNVPCYIVDVGDENSSLMALVENLQRRDLDFFEEAEGYRRLIETCSLTQKEAAEKIGRSQSAVANKLRLLRLGGDLTALIRAHSLSERHARALLRIEDQSERLKVAETIAAKRLTVERAERLIDQLLESREQVKKSNTKFIFKDVRIFMNTITKALTAMQFAGFKAEMKQQNEGDDLVLTVFIPNAGKPVK